MKTPEKKVEGRRYIAGPYRDSQKWMAEAVCADMAKGGIEHWLLQNENGEWEVWRTARGYLSFSGKVEGLLT